MPRPECGSTNLVHQEKEPILDHCGVVVAIAPKKIALFSRGLAGLRQIQTRGYDGAGVVAYHPGSEPIIFKGEGTITQVFEPQAIAQLNEVFASLWLYQVRYGTNGGFVSENVQPLVKQHLGGDTFIVAHNGEFSTDPAAADTHLSDSVLFADRLAQASGNTWDERIQHVLRDTTGSWSLAIGTPAGLYLARDPRGIRPLYFGEMFDAEAETPIWVAASETSALEAMSVVNLREVLPGELLKITAAPQTVVHRNGVRPAYCVFESIYIQDRLSRQHAPDQLIETAPTNAKFRQNCGRWLAREFPFEASKIDYVIGIPGTGIDGGKAYAASLNLPYLQAISDVSADNPRTFMTAEIETIYQKVLNNFNFDGKALQGKRLVLVDDSLVRGNVMKGLISLLKSVFGVAEVHVGILCLPIDKPCHLGINTRKAAELIAARHHNQVELIKQEIDADSLHYLTVAGMMAAYGASSTAGFCLGCMAGHQPPLNKQGDIYFEPN